MKQAKRIALTSIIVTSVAMLPGISMAEEGFYIGVGAGGATLDANLSDTALPILGGNFEEDDTAVKVFAGYDWDLPGVTVGIEGSYGIFGEPELLTNFGELTLETTGISLFGTAAIGAGPVEFFGKLGGIAWDTEGSLLGVTESGDGTDLAWGIGIRYNWDRVQLRGEYESFDLDTADLEMLSIGVAFRF